MAYKGRFRPSNPQKYKGDPTKIIYRSWWERNVFSWLDKHKDVIWWQSEEVIVPYRSPIDGRVHRYFPDVIVHKYDGDGKKQTITEKAIISAQQLAKAKDYVKSGGQLNAIKSKYKLTKEQEQELATL